MDTKKLRQKILNLAIHGKLVPQDPNDEPASVLLERIKAEKERLIKEGKIKRSKKPVKTSDTPHYQQVPFEVPDSWTWTTLGEISNYGDCNNVSIIDIATDEWILELEDLEKDTASIIQMLSKKERNIKGVRHKFDKGDVLYSKLRTYLNKVLVAPKTGYCTTEIIPFNSYCGISNFYLCHVLRSAYFLDYTQQCGYGVKMPRLSTNDACKGMIPLPPIAEQQRIVVEIEKWFALIDQVEQDKVDLQTTIKQTKSKILDLAIHGKLVPQDPNDKPAIELLKRINPDFTPCDNGHSRKLPQGWYSVTVNDVCSIIGGVSYNKADIQDTGIRVLRGGNIQNGKVIDCFDDVFISLSYQNNDNQVQRGDIIVVASTGSQTLIGKTGFADRDIPKTQIGAFLRIVRPKQKTLSPYIRLIFQTDAYKDYIRNVAKGSNINNVKNAHLQNFQICLPPLEEQQRIVQKIEELFSSLDDIQKSLEV